MIEQDFLHLLMNGGSNIAFAMFLLWQNKEQQRRSDEKDLKADAREKEIKDRYDKMLQDMQSREDKVRQEIVKEINDLDKRMSLLEQNLQHIAKIVEEIKAKFMRVV